MILFFGNIPSDTRPIELKNFVEANLRRFLFFKPGKVIKSEVLTILDKSTGEREYHGLVHIQPDHAGKTAIQRLDRKIFKNKRIRVREYSQRDWHNDPRAFKKSFPKEKRLRERRRGNDLMIINDYPKVFNSANYNFSRIYDQ